MNVIFSNLRPIKSIAKQASSKNLKLLKRLDTLDKNDDINILTNFVRPGQGLQVLTEPLKEHFHAELLRGEATSSAYEVNNYCTYSGNGLIGDVFSAIRTIMLLISVSPFSLMSVGDVHPLEKRLFSLDSP